MSRSDHREFFEARYRRAGRDADALPWAASAPSSVVTDWVARSEAVPQRAMVIGCGLGDDAEFVAAHGWVTTAFDTSPTAIAWCRERFPDTAVDYRAQDLFDPPTEWPGAFHLVVEVATIQSLAPSVRDEAIRSVARLVAPGGTLLVAALVNAHDVPVHGPPWPLAPGDFAGFVDEGLAEVMAAEHATPWPGVDRAHREYYRVMAGGGG